MRTRLLARLSAWLVGSIATVSFAQAPLPLDYFTRSDELGAMELSPDGSFIAITTGQHGAEFLTFFDLQAGKPSASVRAPRGLAIQDFYWSSNERVIFMIAERQPGRVRPTSTGEIFAVDRDGKRQVMIYGYRAGEMSTGTHRRVREASYSSPNVVSLLRADDRNILITEMPWRLSGGYWYFNPDAKPTITRLDTLTGNETNLGGVPLAGASVIVDGDDVPRLAIGLNDGGDLSVAWKRSKDAAAWEAFELPGFRERTVKPLRFTPDNAAILFTGVREGERFAALFQLTLADHSVKQLIDIPGTDVLDIVTDFQDREVIGVTGYADKLVYGWLRPDHPAVRLHKGMQHAFDGNEVRFISHSADGNKAIVFVTSDVAPGEYFLVDTQTKKADIIMAARSWIGHRKMRSKEPIELAARDGLPLHGYLTRPAHPGPYPLVVLPHGGPHFVRDEWGFDPEVQLLASRGYAVLQVNFRGSGGYGLDFEAAGFRQWGARMQDDVTDATRWAIEHKITTPDRICIFGTSYGGFAALMGAAREPTLYRCAIGYAGIYDMQLMYESGDVPDSRMGLGFLSKVLGTDAAELRARSPTTHAKDIQAPVLLIHGKEDFRSDYQHAVRMKAELEKHDKPVEWLVFRGEGHGVYDDEARLSVYKSILAFLDKHIGKGAQPQSE